MDIFDKDTEKPVLYALYDSRTYPVMDTSVIKKHPKNFRFARSPELAVRTFTYDINNDTFVKAVLLPYIKIMAASFTPNYSYSSVVTPNSIQKETYIADYDILAQIFMNSW